MLGKDTRILGHGTLGHISLFWENLDLNIKVNANLNITKHEYTECNHRATMLLDVIQVYSDLHIYTLLDSIDSSL